MTLSFRQLAVVAALVVLAFGPASADYQRATYPQTPAHVESVSVSAPAHAALGSRIIVHATVNVISPLTDAPLVYVYLDRSGVVWHAQVVDPHPASPAWKPGANRLADVSVNVPRNIPPGDYRVVVGVYKEKTRGSAPIKLSGQTPARLDKIITTGRYVDKYGVRHDWFINNAHALIWDGKPWIPAGGMFVYGRDWNTVKAQLDLLHRYGVKSLYLHLGVNQPYPWKTYSDDDYRFFQKTIDYMDKLGMTYGVEFEAFEAKGPGYYYPGGGPRVEITNSGVVHAEQDKTISGLFAVFNADTGSLVQTGKATVTDGKNLEADVTVPHPGHYKVIFGLTRQAPDSYSMYYWDNQYKNYVNVVRKHYDKVNMGPGFRFVVDPLWNEMNMNRDFLPSAPAYAEEQADWLRQRYGTVGRLNAAWRPLGAPVSSFQQAGRLMPLDRMKLGDDKNDSQYLMDPQTMDVFRLDMKTSQYNYDEEEFLGKSLLHYTCDMADQFKKIDDVPVIYKGFSDMDFWHINDLGTPGGHDGLGMESYGNGEPLLMFMGIHLYGELEQATKTTWLVVTETGEGNHQDNSPSRNKGIGYTSRLDNMYANYNAMLSGGAKGIFQFNMVPGDGTNDPWTDALTPDPRQLEWLGTYADILAHSPNLANYKPYAYFRYPGLYNPNAMSLFSDPDHDYYNMGGWWWREPVERSRNDIWIVPTFSLRPKTPMFIVNLEDKPASERHRAELEKALKDGVRITMIGFRKDLGEIPPIDKYYTSRFAIDQAGRKFQVLKPTPTSRILGKNKQGLVWNLIDGKLQINSEQVFGMHGYRPDHLVTGPEKNVGPYYGMFSKLLGVKLLGLDGGLYGLCYKSAGVPVTVIGLKDRQTRTLTFHFPAGLSVQAHYPNGDVAAESHDGTLTVQLAPASDKLIQVSQWKDRDKDPFLRQGIMLDTLNAKDSVIIHGLPAANSIPAEAAAAAIRSDEHIDASLPASAGGAFAKVIAGAKTEELHGKYGAAVRTATIGADHFFQNETPYIWIEAENRISSNFNYSRLGAIPTLSGGAFLGLETAVAPPADTGWYAKFAFDASKAGAYQLWVRGDYLSYSSPCDWRIDDGAWHYAPNTLVPYDADVVDLYNPVEDSRQVFGWYHYGQTELTKGRHTLTIRVTQKRGEGLAVTMANDRQYAKIIDCMILTHRGFVPDGSAKPRYLLNKVEPAMVNMIPNPSFEFRPKDSEKIPAGWVRSEDSEGLIWQDAGWGSYNVMPGISTNLGQRYAYVGQRNLTIKPGTAERFWRTVPLAVKAGQDYYFEAFLRTVGLDANASTRVVWLDAAGDPIRTDTRPPITGDTDWTKEIATLKAPAEAASAEVYFAVSPGKNGVAYFDDVVLAKEPPAITVR